MSQITKEEIDQYLEKLQVEITKASAATASELYDLDCEAWRTKNFEKFFAHFSTRKCFTDIVRKLFSPPDCQYGVSYSDAEYLQGLVNQDTVLMLLEDVVTSAFAGKKDLVKKLDKENLCQHVKTCTVLRDFCEYFHCNEDKREILIYQLNEVDIIAEAMPIYLFFAYLQIDKHLKGNGSKSFLDTNIIKMQTLDAGYLRSGIRFMDFLFERRGKINYPLNLYLLNRYLFVPDTVFFCEYPEAYLEQINDAVKEAKGFPIDFVDFGSKEAVLKHEADWKDVVSFTMLRPMLCKWYLYSLWPNNNCNLFQMNDGFKALDHLLSCVEEEIFSEWNKQDSQSFCNFYKMLCSLSRKCNIPFSSTFSDVLDESHGRFYNAIRKHYKVNRTTDTTFPTTGK